MLSEGRHGFASFVDGVAMARVVIREYKFHLLSGEYPEIDTYTQVDTALLYEGDDKPFHIVLPIARVGEISANGLLYDEELVSRVEAQLAGQGGIRGHQKDEDMQFMFPYDAVDWIGHKRVGEYLWAKGYIPPGSNREDIRRRKARGGGVGTSIFGEAVKEFTTLGKRKVWKAKNFELESLDLGASKQVSLKLGGNFAIVGELQKEGLVPPETDITISDVPQTVREQIIRQAQLEGTATRVAELETANQQLTQQVSEMRQYASIVAEIRSYAGPDTDVAKQFKTMYDEVAKLRETLGPEVNIVVTVSEMHNQIAEFKTREFNIVVDAKIAELTPWAVTRDEHKARVTSFRTNMRRAVLAELKGERDQVKVAEIANRLWDEEYKPLAEGMVREFAGPSAVIAGQNARQQNATDADIKAVKEKWDV